MLLTLNKIPKWVKILNSAGFNTDELEQRLDSLLETCRQEEKYYRKTVLPQVQKDIHDWKQECSQDVIECRARYLEGKQFESQAEFQQLQMQAKHILKNKADVPTELIQQGERVQKKLNGYKNALDILHGRKIGIDDEMIATAKAFPLERLIEINLGNFAKCLWHSDTKPSLFCRNNFVHCFTCEKQGTAIDVYMKLHDVEFKEAVLSLNNL